MKKNIIISVLAVLVVTLTVYASVKKDEAEKQSKLVEKYMDDADRYGAMAKHNEEKAVELAARERIATLKAIEMQRKWQACRDNLSK